LNIVENQDKYALSFPNPRNRKLNIFSHQTFHFVKKHGIENGKWLDIGCGNGSLL